MGVLMNTNVWLHGYLAEIQFALKKSDGQVVHVVVFS